MQSIREIKLRMKSIHETQQITNAMKLISAAKLKKARQQLEHSRPYFQKVKTTMADILIHSPGITSRYFDERPDKPEKKTGLFVLSGDKGLAGGYNHNIFKLTDQMVSQQGDPLLFVAGIMGLNYFSRKQYAIDPTFHYPVQNPTVYRAREISELLLDRFLSGELDEVYLVYTQMISSLTLVPRSIRLLPLSLDHLKADLSLELGEGANGTPINYEPSPAAVFDVLIPKYLSGLLYGAFVEAYTSEQSARMTAMDNSTTNANKMLQKLNLQYNRARQSAITQEISEIVGGAAAL